MKCPICGNEMQTKEIEILCPEHSVSLVDGYVLRTDIDNLRVKEICIACDAIFEYPKRIKHSGAGAYDTSIKRHNRIVEK